MTFNTSTTVTHRKQNKYRCTFFVEAHQYDVLQASISMLLPKCLVTLKSSRFQKLSYDKGDPHSTTERILRFNRINEADIFQRQVAFRAGQTTLYPRPSTWDPFDSFRTYLPLSEPIHPCYFNSIDSRPCPRLGPSNAHSFRTGSPPEWQKRCETQSKTSVLSLVRTWKNFPVHRLIDILMNSKNKVLFLVSRI